MITAASFSSSKGVLCTTAVDADEDGKLIDVCAVRIAGDNILGALDFHTSVSRQTWAGCALDRPGTPSIP